MGHWLRATVVMAVFALVGTPVLAAGQGRYIVKFRDAGAGRAQVAAAGGRVVLELPAQQAVAAHLPDAAVTALSRSPAIAYVEEDGRRYLSSQTVPYGIEMVQAPDVWGGADGAGITVCVIDSGLYMGHEDIQDSGVSGYPSGWNSDSCGHGTHVVGTMAALDNATGVVGVNPSGLDLYVVKVFGDDCAWAYASTLVDAAYRCQAAGANVISMSLGGTFKSVTEESAFADLYAAGILSVAAAGNDGNTRLSYPASYDSVMSVAAVDAAGQWASFSQANSAVEVSAPGVAVTSTVPWQDTNTVTVGGVTYTGGWIEFAARSAGVTGILVDGGLCIAPGAWSGRVVLCERGDISFFDKVSNVSAGGGVAAVIFNNEPGPFAGTLGDGNSSTIPAISLSQEDGLVLRAGALGQDATVQSIFSAPGSGYEAWDGTSMATPHVAGVAALVWSQDPSWTNVQIRDALVATAQDLNAAGYDNYTGYGLIQAKAALDYLQGTPPPPGDLALSVTASKYRGTPQAILSWSGAAGAQVDVFRDGGLLTTTANDGAFVDDTLVKGTSTATYQVCEAGTSVCSASVQATW